jgi:hypothetical protein
MALGCSGFLADAWVPVCRTSRVHCCSQIHITIITCVAVIVIGLQPWLYVVPFSYNKLYLDEDESKKN